MDIAVLVTMMGKSKIKFQYQIPNLFFYTGGFKSLSQTSNLKSYVIHRSQIFLAQILHVKSPNFKTT